MPDELSYLCRNCGERHEDLPMSYGADAPAYWDPSFAQDESSVLDQEQCIIRGEHFFIRGRLVIPVLDAAPGTEFDWGVWVSLSRASFDRALTLWATPGREQEPPYFGWLSTELPYPVSTLELKTHVHTRAVGSRPLVELEPTDHPLAVEQRNGITLARVQEIAEMLLHGLDGYVRRSPAARAGAQTTPAFRQDPQDTPQRRQLTASSISKNAGIGALPASRRRRARNRLRALIVAFTESL